MINRDAPKDDHAGAGVEESQRQLTVEIEVQAFSGAELCPMLYNDNENNGVEHHLVGETCYVKCHDPDESVTVQYKRENVDSSCLCRVVASHDCMPSIQRFSESALIIRTNPTDRESLRTLIEDLREVSESVRIHSLVMDNDDVDAESTFVSLQPLTDTERETLERAILAGYYDRQRSMEFDELAAEFDISKPALSNRLTSAEAKVMRELFSSK